MTNNADSHTQPALWDTPEGPAEAAKSVEAKPTYPASFVKRPTEPMEFSELWSVKEVANYLGVPKQTVYCWRTSGYGPQGFRVGKHLRWRAATVIAWTLEMERQQ